MMCETDFHEATLIGIGYRIPHELRDRHTKCLNNLHVAVQIDNRKVSTLVIQLDFMISCIITFAMNVQ